ncbi:MAG TPA: hypothetical protein VK009_14090 [Chloroflexota bacterium]|nr:hypothetical protein [Chloroflexota bacterium]
MVRVNAERQGRAVFAEPGTTGRPSYIRAAAVQREMVREVEAEPGRSPGWPRRRVDVEPPQADARDQERSLDEETFTQCLRRIMQGHGINMSQLARYSWLDVGYVSRLCNLNCDPRNPVYRQPFETRNPSRDVVIRLGLAMQLPMEEMEELLLAAGYAPLVR